MYFEPAKREQDTSSVRGFRIFKNSPCQRVLSLLEAGNLRLKGVVGKRITAIKFGVNDGGSNGSYKEN